MKVVWIRTPKSGSRQRVVREVTVIWNLPASDSAIVVYRNHRGRLIHRDVKRSNLRIQKDAA